VGGVVKYRRISTDNQRIERRLLSLLKHTPIPDSEILLQLGLFMNGPLLARILFMDELYRLILDRQGVIMEFGTRWGQNLVLWTNMRGMYEPFNYNRKIVGFDTFTGFPGVHIKDGEEGAKGDYAATPHYEQYLRTIMRCHEGLNPVPHIPKWKIVAGDVRQTLPQYLEEHPETIVALAYFDLDLYEPTKLCLEVIRPHLARGSILGFDQLASPRFPGETVALREVLDLSRFELRRSRHSRMNCYAFYM